MDKTFIQFLYEKYPLFKERDPSSLHMSVKQIVDDYNEYLKQTKTNELN